MENVARMGEMRSREYWIAWKDSSCKHVASTHPALGKYV
jgi:hypothetical protein